MKQTILITGNSGFIGSNLTRTFCANGHHVIGIDLRPPRFYPPDDFRVLDVRNQDGLKHLIREKKPDIILHLAAVSTVQKGASNPAYTQQVNVIGTQAVLNAAEVADGQPWIIYVSTDKVYGPLPTNRSKYTEDLPIQPLQTSPYDASKAAADRLVQSRSTRLPVTILRLCNIYGPYDVNSERIVPANVQAMLAGRPGILNRYRDKDGHIHNFYRDMLYVGDLCSAFSLLLNALETDAERFRGEIFNVGAPECLSMEQVLAEIRKICGCQFDPEVHCTEGTNELNIQSMSMEKIQKYLGFSPKTKLPDGIHKTIDWWRSQIDILIE